MSTGLAASGFACCTISPLPHFHILNLQSFPLGIPMLPISNEQERGYDGVHGKGVVADSVKFMILRK